jgi:hypothetical protein
MITKKKCINQLTQKRKSFCFGTKHNKATGSCCPSFSNRVGEVSYGCCASGTGPIFEVQNGW